MTVGDITRVLDEKPSIAYRTTSATESSEKIFEMLNLFYVNKNIYRRLSEISK